ncbi:MAG: terminase small subunit [Planctomycetota bacterium]
MADEQQANPVGRPSKYTPDMPDRCRAYIRNYASFGNRLPAQPGFGQSVGVSEKTVANWGKEHPEFLLALEELHSAQHQILLDKGLGCEFSSTITKLVLSSNHGYKERTDTTSAGEKIEPKCVSFLDAMNAVNPQQESQAEQQETPEQ